MKAFLVNRYDKYYLCISVTAQLQFAHLYPSCLEFKRLSRPTVLLPSIVYSSTVHWIMLWHLSLTTFQHHYQYLLFTGRCHCLDFLYSAVDCWSHFEHSAQSANQQNFASNQQIQHFAQQHCFHQCITQSNGGQSTSGNIRKCVYCLVHSGIYSSIVGFASKMQVLQGSPKHNRSYCNFTILC